MPRSLHTAKKKPEKELSSTLSSAVLSLFSDFRKTLLCLIIIGIASVNSYAVKYSNVKIYMPKDKSQDVNTLGIPTYSNGMGSGGPHFMMVPYISGKICSLPMNLLPFTG